MTWAAGSWFCTARGVLVCWAGGNLLFFAHLARISAGMLSVVSFFAGHSLLRPGVCLQHEGLGSLTSLRAPFCHPF